MATFVFRAKDGKIIYCDASSTTFSINDTNPSATTYVYAGGRNATSGIEVSQTQINQARLDFVMEYIQRHGHIWKVDFTDEHGLVFNNEITVPTGRKAASATETLVGAILQVAVPK